MPGRDTLRTTLIVDVVLPRNPVVGMPAELSYDPCDPLAVVVSVRSALPFLAHQVLGRDLLEAGLRERSGEGAIRIGPMWERPGVLRVDLMAVRGRPSLLLWAQDVAEFLERTYDLVAPDDEIAQLGIDAALGQLLAAG